MSSAACWPVLLTGEQAATMCSVAAWVTLQKLEVFVIAKLSMAASRHCCHVSGVTCPAQPYLTPLQSPASQRTSKLPPTYIPLEVHYHAHQWLICLCKFKSDSLQTSQTAKDFTWMQRVFMTHLPLPSPAALTPALCTCMSRGTMQKCRHVPQEWSMQGSSQHTEDVVVTCTVRQ